MSMKNSACERVTGSHYSDFLESCALAVGIVSDGLKGNHVWMWSCKVQSAFNKSKTVKSCQTSLLEDVYFSKVTDFRC